MWKGKLRIPKKISYGFVAEISIRILLLLLFIFLEQQTAFKREIHPDEMWLYKNPHMLSYVPAMFLWPIGVFVTMGTFLIFYFLDRDLIELVQAHMAASLSIALTLLLTDIIKLTVGRPRPDFFYRCFPDGVMNDDMECTGDPIEVRDGRKSFPSGHASYSFASFGFCTFYLFGKLHVFNENGRGQSWRILVALLPSFAALAIAISRTCDYHHHWQDVAVGSVIGISFAYLCYRQYYPPLDSTLPHLSYIQQKMRNSAKDPIFLNAEEAKGFTKWI